MGVQKNNPAVDTTPFASLHLIILGNAVALTVLLFVLQQASLIGFYLFWLLWIMSAHHSFWLLCQKRSLSIAKQVLGRFCSASARTPLAAAASSQRRSESGRRARASIWSGQHF